MGAAAAARGRADDFVNSCFRWQKWQKWQFVYGRMILRKSGWETMPGFSFVLDYRRASEAQTALFTGHRVKARGIILRLVGALEGAK